MSAMAFKCASISSTVSFVNNPAFPSISNGDASSSSSTVAINLASSPSPSIVAIDSASTSSSSPEARQYIKLLKTPYQRCILRFNYLTQQRGHQLNFQTRTPILILILVLNRIHSTHLQARRMTFQGLIRRINV